MESLALQKGDGMNQEQTPLLQAVTDLIETDPAYFKVPGHRLDKGICPRWTDRVGTWKA